MRRKCEGDVCIFYGKRKKRLQKWRKMKRKKGNREEKNDKTKQRIYEKQEKPKILDCKNQKYKTSLCEKEKGF